MVGPADRTGRPPDVWETLVRWRGERRRFVLLTVIESRGFTPQKAGARMLRGAGGEIVGTIGGGAIEHAALAEAEALLTTGGSTVLRRHLTQELGMCCGGEMTVFIELVAPAPRLLLLGAGTIAKPLASMALLTGFHVTVVDERSEWATGERFPGAVVLCRAPEHALRDLAAGPEDYVLVVTHDHALDQRLVQDLLRRPVAFLGMVGSVPKQRKFALRLRARGFSDAEIARLRTPVGLAIGAATAEEIAVSILAELIAVRRGHTPEPGWLPRAAEKQSNADHNAETKLQAEQEPSNGADHSIHMEGRSR
jgi:xanthine dehydrogenase accessory factor